MPPYSYITVGKYFDLTLPKPVLDIVEKVPAGDSAMFHFVDSVDSMNTSSKPTLTVRKLDDGSLNFSNKKETAEESGLNPANVFIVINPDLNMEEVDKVTASVNTTANIAREAADKVKATIQALNESAVNATDEDKVELNEDADDENNKEYESDQAGFMDHDYMGASNEETENLPSEEESHGVKRKHEEEEEEEVEFIISLAKEETESFKCPICPGHSKDHWNLWKHVSKYHRHHEAFDEVVEQIKPWLRSLCQKCNKVFSNPKILKEHEQTVHHEFVGVMCAHCKKKFKTEHHLKIHIKYMHLREENSLLCSYCPSKFSSKNVLREHLRYMHTDQKRDMQCTECDFKYAFHKQYYEHYTRVHGPKKHMCPHCSYKCATKWYMRKHIKGCVAGRQLTESVMVDPESVMVQSRPVTPITIIPGPSQTHEFEQTETSKSVGVFKDISSELSQPEEYYQEEPEGMPEDQPSDDETNDRDGEDKDISATPHINNPATSSSTGRDISDDALDLETKFDIARTLTSIQAMESMQHVQTPTPQTSTQQVVSAASTYQVVEQMGLAIPNSVVAQDQRGLVVRVPGIESDAGDTYQIVEEIKPNVATVMSGETILIPDENVETFEVDASTLAALTGGSENQSVVNQMVTEDQLTRISLSAADGTQQTIELIIPAEHVNQSINH